MRVKRGDSALVRRAPAPNLVSLSPIVPAPMVPLSMIPVTMIPPIINVRCQAKRWHCLDGNAGQSQGFSRREREETCHRDSREQYFLHSIHLIVLRNTEWSEGYIPNHVSSLSTPSSNKTDRLATNAGIARAPEFNFC
jgi:hypothetical protein